MSRTDKCELCRALTSFERIRLDDPPEGDVCYQCDTWICVGCTDYSYMNKMNTETPICINCGKENMEPNLPEDDPRENR